MIPDRPAPYCSLMSTCIFLGETIGAFVAQDAAQPHSDSISKSHGSGADPLSGQFQYLGQRDGVRFRCGSDFELHRE